MNSLIVFFILATVIIVSSVLAVATRRILRAAIYLLFVLIGTGGLYLLLNYHFLAAVQIAVYAGGILILFLFAILLTRPKGDEPERMDKSKVIMGAFAALSGLVVTLVIVFKNFHLFPVNETVIGDQEVNMKEIGLALIGTGKYEYLMPFEILSVLLLAAIIGGILIARKRN